MTEHENLDEKHLTLVEHLTELRDRLIKSLYVVFAAFLVCWFFSEKIFDIIRRPIAPYLKTSSGGLIFTAPMDKFMAHLKVSVLAGAIISCPFWIYQLWKFIAPGLYKNEKKWSLIFVGFGSFLFTVGCCFVYFVVYPLAFNYLMNFGGSTDVPMITITDYISFFMTTTLVFGLAFEMPLILTFLGMIGVIDSTFLSKNRRYAIVILAALSAIFTPPDVLSMVMMMIPMVLLYESSVILVKITGQKKNS
ncbi:MAG: twin-arginine translocase subunit TatC [Bdellovibrionales bacterium]|nr:twin-arginine translocase subunit TatC [Bdellovibrionales bacterium]